MKQTVTELIAAQSIGLQGKLTVRHYLRKNLESKDKGKKNKYPVYVRVLLNRISTDFRSGFDDILSNRPPARIPFFPLEQQLARVEIPKIPQQYFTEAEFASIQKAIKQDQERYRVKLSIETEFNRIYGLADLLRQHGYNLADNSSIGNPVQNQLMHPIEYALDWYLKSELDKFIRKSRMLNGSNDQFCQILNWTNGFIELCHGILSLGKTEFNTSLKLRFTNELEIYSDISQFVKSGSAGSLCYEWRYRNLFPKFDDFYDTKIKTIGDSERANYKVQIIKNALVAYFSNLGELGDRLFPYPTK